MLSDQASPLGVSSRCGLQRSQLYLMGRRLRVARISELNRGGGLILGRSRYGGDGNRGDWNRWNLCGFGGRCHLVALKFGLVVCAFLSGRRRLFDRFCAGGGDDEAALSALLQCPAQLPRADGVREGANLESVENAAPSEIHFDDDGF